MTLGLSHITFAPGFTSETHPGGPASFTDNEWIDAFYSSYSYWILQPAQLFISNPNAGFAILFLLCPYFQMIGRTQKGHTWDDREEFQDGLLSVFDRELDSESDTSKQEISDWLYYNMRCEIAHGNLLGKGIALSDDYKPAIWWSMKKNGSIDGVGVNPRLWFERINEHFNHYRSELLEPGRRKNFLKYVKHQLAIKST